MKTLAVVVGNINYYKGYELKCAIADAQAMADVFQRLGYDVIQKYDSSANDCLELLQEIDNRIANYDATIFYFAGHGFQYQGENYLASVECQIGTPDAFYCSRYCIKLSELLDIYKTHQGKINIVIIDACRRSFDRGASSTFTPVQAPRGTLIAYSTSPNEGANDGGFEGHSIYTGALLRYIGREFLSVEELFKKVRKTVFNLSDGKQTTWEHTSLIGDFYFNSGQMIYSMKLPYDESVVKDNMFDIHLDDFSCLIGEMKSHNWDRQNPAIDKLLEFPVAELDKNKQFILGRNLLQASDSAFHAANFFERLRVKLVRFSKKDENHLLNGILFEMYFDSFGQFRNNHIKNNCFEEVMALRKDPSFAKSFEFIRNALSPHRETLIWVPGSSDNKIDVDILAIFDGGIRQLINKVNVCGKDITRDIVNRYGASIGGGDVDGLKKVLAYFLNMPRELLHINSNLELRNIGFAPNCLPPLIDNSLSVV